MLALFVFETGILGGRRSDQKIVDLTTLTDTGGRLDPSETALPALVRCEGRAGSMGARAVGIGGSRRAPTPASRQEPILLS